MEREGAEGGMKCLQAVPLDKIKLLNQKSTEIQTHHKYEIISFFKYHILFLNSMYAKIDLNYQFL